MKINTDKKNHTFEIKHKETKVLVGQTTLYLQPGFYKLNINPDDYSDPLTPEDKKAVFNALVASLGGRQKFTVFALGVLTINGKPISKGCVDKWFSGQLIPDITLELLRFKIERDPTHKS